MGNVRSCVIASDAPASSFHPVCIELNDPARSVLSTNVNTPTLRRTTDYANDRLRRAPAILEDGSDGRGSGSNLMGLLRMRHCGDTDRRLSTKFEMQNGFNILLILILNI